MVWFWGVLAVGFVAAVVLGSLAWYNSEKPAGWDFADTPDWAKQNWAKSSGEQGVSPTTDFANSEPKEGKARTK
jgi:hypothetical protein